MRIFEETCPSIEMMTDVPITRSGRLKKLGLQRFHFSVSTSFKISSDYLDLDMYGANFFLSLYCSYDRNIVDYVLTI